MGTSIITAVATMALIVVLTLGFTTSYQSQVNLTQQSEAALRLQGQRVRTAMSITSVNTAGNQVLTLTVLNSGSTEVTQYAQMDVLVTYTDSVAQVVQRLQYVASNPSPGQWSAGPVSPQPVSGVWSPSASLTISAQLPSQRTSGTGSIVIGTPNGVTTSALF